MPVAVEGETLAVSDTVCPYGAGFADEVRIVVVGMPFTVCVKVCETFGRSLLSPL